MRSPPLAWGGGDSAGVPELAPFPAPRVTCLSPLGQASKRPPKLLPKASSAHAVAFISNCFDVYTDRLAYIKKMIAAGLRVDLYGLCVGAGARLAV